MKLNYIYIAIYTVKLVKVINSIWSWYYQFYTIITCTDTHSLLRGVLKRRYLKSTWRVKQMFTSYPICQFYIFVFTCWSCCSSWLQDVITTFSVIMQYLSECKEFLSRYFKDRIWEWQNQTQCRASGSLWQRFSGCPRFFKYHIFLAYKKMGVMVQFFSHHWWHHAGQDMKCCEQCHHVHVW